MDPRSVLKCPSFYQMKMDLTKDDIRKIVVDLPMDKNYKISVQDFCRTPILSDEVFKFMDRNNDGQISKGELKLARKSLTLKQIDHLIKKLDKGRRRSRKIIIIIINICISTGGAKKLEGKMYPWYFDPSCSC